MSTATDSRLPAFVIIGGMKCGTTSLFRYLGEHPGLAPCKHKEPGFFSKNNWHRGIDWYRNLFADGDRLNFEASTNYTKHPNFGPVPERMAQVIPHAKFIYIIRHPVERLQSELVHNLRAGRLAYEQFFSSRFWDQGVEFHVGCSKYYWQLEQYLGFFNRERFCIITLEELSTQPVQTLNTVLDFLGVEQKFEEGRQFRQYNAAGRISIRRTWRRWRTPWNRKQFTLNATQKQRIWEACVGDIARLEQWTGRSFGFKPPGIDREGV